MTVHPNARNLARDIVRQAWPKGQHDPKPRRRTGASQAVLTLVKARAGGRCERCAFPVPRDAETHHRIPRGMGGSRDPRINLPSNLVSICRSCHRWAESHRDDAYRTGWLVHRTAEPLNAPLDSRLHGCVLLADDGSIRPIEGAAS